MTGRQEQAVGIPWFDSDNYRLARRFMADAQTLPRQYDAWLSEAQSIEASVIRSGRIAMRVPIEVHDFIAWCLFHGRDPDGGARQRFATLVASQGPERRT
ncbi:hypothetical protein [uncultured Methylobacterium sp.]|mgnify:CR=1 FL=1|jgi:hypothetical protein|uniref:hypothetical protein n=1 Tax=uncultured Methylobacterium sp. TaxID=157278 RepID=UPI002606220C|nr:hypothetical protein [uncultured Methylobacterium sp.]